MSSSACARVHCRAAIASFVRRPDIDFVSRQHAYEFTECRQQSHSTLRQRTLVNLRGSRDPDLLSAAKLLVAGMTRMIVRAVGAAALLLISLSSEASTLRHQRPKGPHFLHRG
jgi:hypothetical protein